MIGEIVVLEPHEFQAWLAGGAAATSPAAAGEKLFSRTWPASPATRATAPRAGPNLAGVFGSQVQLAGGSTVNADENYLRESILNPQRRGGGRLPADHADLPGPGQRGACT